MRSAGVVEAEVTADRGAGLGDRVVGFQINLLVFDRSPQALDEHIIQLSRFAEPALMMRGDLGTAQRVGAPIKFDIWYEIACHEFDYSSLCDILSENRHLGIQY